MDFIVYACFNLVGNVTRGILGPLHPMIFWVLGLVFLFKTPWRVELQTRPSTFGVVKQIKNNKKEKETLPHGAFLSSLFLPLVLVFFKWKSSSLNISSSSINSNNTRWGGYFSPSLLALVNMEFLSSSLLFSNGKGGNKELGGALTFCWHFFLRHLSCFVRVQQKKRKRRSIGLNFHK